MAENIIYLNKYVLNLNYNLLFKMLLSTSFSYKLLSANKNIVQYFFWIDELKHEDRCESPRVYNVRISLWAIGSTTHVKMACTKRLQSVLRENKHFKSFILLKVSREI